MIANIRQYFSLLIYQIRNSVVVRLLKYAFYFFISLLSFSFIGLEIHHFLTTLFVSSTKINSYVVLIEPFKQYFIFFGAATGLFFAYKNLDIYRKFFLILLHYLVTVIIIFILWFILKEDINSDVPWVVLHLTQLISAVFLFLFYKKTTRFIKLYSGLTLKLFLVWFIVHHVSQASAENIVTNWSDFKNWVEEITGLEGFFFDIPFDYIYNFFGLGSLAPAFFHLNRKRKTNIYKKARKKNSSSIRALERRTSVSQILREVTEQVSKPITSIKTDTEAASGILKISKCDTEVDRIIDGVAVNAGYCFDLFANINNISPKKEPSKVQAMINEGIKQVVDSFRARLERNNIAIELNLDKTKPSVFMNLLELEQVILNLGTNSIRAMLNNNKAKNKLTITSQTSDDMVQIIVEDTGCEIQNVEELFSLFKSKKIQRPYDKGLGLSLFLNRKTITSYQGTLELLSNSEMGSKFIIELPK